jgi:hypothetical protein
MNNMNNKYCSTYSNDINNVLLNPHTPPISRNHYNTPQINEINNNCTNCINQKTNIGYVQDKYSQIGILTSINIQNKILPLMGRILYKNRDKWQYYAINDDNNAVKLSLIVDNKRCTNEYGCKELSTDDIVNIDGSNDKFKIVIYDINDNNYIPII